MMETESLSLLFALAIGFTHAFEVDHLVAVSSMATKRDSIWQAMKDGIFWGLGHTSTIFLIGMIMIVGKWMISNDTFSVLEGAVGLMLVILGILRIKDIRKSKSPLGHSHTHSNKIAYGVGLVHGLAGSGTIVLFVLLHMKSISNGLMYLLTFGLGSILGMLVASGVLSVPFSKKLTSNQKVKLGLSYLSAVLCIVIGGQIISENFL